VRRSKLSCTYLLIAFFTVSACSPTDGVSVKTPGGGDVSLTAAGGTNTPNIAPRCGLLGNGSTGPLTLSVGENLNYSTDNTWDPAIYKTAWYGTRNGAMDMMDVENTVMAYNGPLFLEAAGNSYTRWLLITNRSTRQIVCDSRTSGGAQRGALMIGVRNLEVAAKTIEQVTGRTFYLLDPAFECNQTNGNRVKTFREAIAFVAGTGVLRRVGCAETSTTAEFTSAYQFTTDLKFLQVGGQTYSFLATEPVPVRVAKLQKSPVKGPQERKPASQK
jgi:hypothetical protein